MSMRKGDCEDFRRRRRYVLTKHKSTTIVRVRKAIRSGVRSREFTSARR